MTRDGWIVLSAHRHRTQEANRRDAFERLAELTPPGHTVVIHLTLTDDHPMAMAVVIIEAVAT